MKRLMILAALLALAIPAGAADICIDASPCYATTSAENAAQVYFRDQHNGQLCASVSLPATCTQAEFDAAGGVGTVYTSTAAGTKAFFLDKIVEHLARQVSSYESEYKGRASNAWNIASSAEKQAACVALGKSADCK